MVLKSFKSDMDNSNNISITKVNLFVMGGVNIQVDLAQHQAFIRSNCHFSATFRGFELHLCLNHWKHYYFGILIHFRHYKYLLD